MISYTKNITQIAILIIVCALITSCSPGSPDPVVERFVYNCQTGNWSGAETLLSERGRLSFEHSDKSLREAYWPVLGLASATGMEISMAALDDIVVVTSSQPSSGTASVMVNIRNSALFGDATDNMKSRLGVDSLDVSLRFRLVLESNRWKIETITIMGGDDVKEQWERAAERSP